MGYGKTAQDNEHFQRVRDEVIMHGSQLINDGYVSIPNDTDLVEELAAFTYEPNSRGQITVSRKKDMKKILTRSTDKADTLFMGLWAAKKASRLQPVTIGASTEAKDWDPLEYGL